MHMSIVPGVPIHNYKRKPKGYHHWHARIHTIVLYFSCTFLYKNKMTTSIPISIVLVKVRKCVKVNMMKAVCVIESAYSIRTMQSTASNGSRGRSEVSAPEETHRFYICIPHSQLPEVSFPWSIKAREKTVGSVNRRANPESEDWERSCQVLPGKDWERLGEGFLLTVVCWESCFVLMFKVKVQCMH